MANPYPVYVEDEAGRMGAGKGQGEAGEAGLAAGEVGFTFLGRGGTSGLRRTAARRDYQGRRCGGNPPCTREAACGRTPQTMREAAHPDCAT